MSILVIGSVNLDVSAKVSRLPLPGETVTGATLTRSPGGKGANQAYAACRLGETVHLVASVGADSEAQLALALLTEAGVDLSHCVTDDNVPTGVALICVDDNGENNIVVAPGANRELKAERTALPKADALICQLEIPIEAVAYAVKQFPAFTCINLAPARAVDSSVLSNADLIIVNETEAAWYGDQLSHYNGLIATTLGAKGAEISKQGDVLARVASPVVDVVDTTGAGDTFTAALTIALVKNVDYAEALNFACTAAALSTTKQGAQTSVPSLSEVNDAMRNLA